MSIARKSAASIAEPDTIDCIHAGSSARAAMAIALIATTHAMTALRKDLKLHLLRADVVSNIFSGNGERVDARRERRRNQEFTSVGTNLRIPAQVRRGQRSCGIAGRKPRREKLRRRCSFRTQCKQLAGMNARSVEMDANRWRRRGDDECLLLGVAVSALVTQDEADRISAIVHFTGREEACLPHAVAVSAGVTVLARKMPQRLRETERKERDHRCNGGISVHTKYRITGANDAWSQQRSRHSEKRCIRSDKFVAARERNDLVDGCASLTIASDLRQKRIHAGLRPQSWKLGMVERLGGKLDLRNRAQSIVGMRHEADAFPRSEVVAHPCGERAVVHLRIERINRVNRVRGSDIERKPRHRPRRAMREEGGELGLKRLSGEYVLKQPIVLREQAQQREIGIVPNSKDVRAWTRRVRPRICIGSRNFACEYR